MAKAAQWPPLNCLHRDYLLSFLFFTMVTIFFILASIFVSFSRSTSCNPSIWEPSLSTFIHSPPQTFFLFFFGGVVRIIRAISVRVYMAAQKQKQNEERKHCKSRGRTSVGATEIILLKKKKIAAGGSTRTSSSRVSLGF